MSNRSGWLVVLITSALLLAVVIGIQANGKAQAAATAPAGAVLAYSGRLTADTGQAVENGAYDFTFAIYDAAEGGTLVWSELQSGVAVQAGAFSASLGRVAALPAAARDGQKWLAIGVRGPGETEFTALSPRQALSSVLAQQPAAPAAPAAGPSCAHDHLGETWPATGAFPTNANFGMVIKTAGFGGGLSIESDAPAGSMWPALKTSSTAAGVGLDARSVSGIAISANSETGAGVYAKGYPAVKANGAYKTNADSILYLSPHDMVVRGLDNNTGTFTGLTFIPQANGGMLIRNDTGTGTKIVSLPVSTLGVLFGSPLYISRINVCYQVSGAPGKIGGTGVFKFNGTNSWTTYLGNSTAQTSVTRACYQIEASWPRVAIDNSSWVQFSLIYTGTGTSADIVIYSVNLTLSELADPGASW